MACFDLSDFECSVIEPLLPTKVRGVARVDDGQVLMGYSNGCRQARREQTFSRATNRIRPA